MFKRLLSNIKGRSNVTLRSWTYQCESILALRSRRVQQLFTFYHRVYGAHGLRQILRSYRHQLQPPLQGFMLSAVGMVGFTVANSIGPGFDWNRERLSLENFDMCRRDIEFVEKLPQNKLCDQCKQKQMKYCYCLVGNKKCRSPTGEKTVRSCRRSLNLKQPPNTVDGTALIEAADENPWEPYFSKDQFLIWRREERTSMYSYKVYARFDDICSADLFHVQTDLAYRKQWDDTAVRLEMIEEDPAPSTNSHLIYWEMQWPKMFANRDYVYSRRFIADHDRKVIMICSRGTKHADYPETSNKVRVTDYWSVMVIKPFRNFQEPGVHYILTYYDDPGLPIPQTIKSWVTQKQMPEFLKKMYNATKHFACRSPLEMQKMHNLGTFDITDDEYIANKTRATSRWLREKWQEQQKRERGK